MRPAVVIVGLAWTSLALMAAAYCYGVRLNVTESMPSGLCLEEPARAIKAGDAAVVCLPATEQVTRYVHPGSCDNGLMPLLKTVAAVPGDVVTIAPNIVSVNGIGLPGSAALDVDGAGRPLTAYPAGVYEVRPGSVFLLSTYSSASFDSRYFGPVSSNTIVAVGRPLWVISKGDTP